MTSYSPFPSWLFSHGGLHSPRTKNVMFLRSLQEILKGKPVFPGLELPTVKALPEGESSDRILKRVQYWTRGFGRRHWRMLQNNMEMSHYSSDVITVIKVAFYKFKVMGMLRPRYKRFYIWFWKNYLDAEHQLVYKKLKDMVLDYEEDCMREFLDESDMQEHHRLLTYLYDEEGDWILPLQCFPLLEVDKGKKMYLCLLDNPISQEMMDELVVLIDQYLESLKIKRFFIPPPDTLFKVGNQKCSDNGEIRRDRDHVSSITGDFIFQRFITQPLTPREVWLPSKIVKYNNNFWQNIGRQILKKDPIYPDDDIRVTYKRLQKSLEGMIRFDLSGFGLQIPREYIELVAKRISLKYQCGQMRDHLTTLSHIFKEVTVRMPDGFSVKPTRGIGLGYYEDLKTIVIQSILKDYNPLSVYGDQGIFGESQGDLIFEAMDKLKYFNFILEDDHIDMLDCNTKGLKWSGARITADKIETQKGLAEPLLGSLFASTHWERKSSLHSLFIEKKDEYLKVNNRVIHAYALLFGSEFGLKDELLDSFEGSGINGFGRLTLGNTRTYAVNRMKTPVAEPLVDVVYSTPFGRHVLGKDISAKEKRKFAKRRKRVYKKSWWSDSTLLDISSPIIKERHSKRVTERLIPHWADLLYLFHHGQTAGTLVSGLWHDDIIKAPYVCPYSSDPFRSFATGGYEVITPKWYNGYNSIPLASKEQVELSAILKDSDYRSHLYIYKGDNEVSQLEKSFMKGPMKRKVASTFLPSRKVPDWNDNFSSNNDEEEWEAYRQGYAQVMSATDDVGTEILSVLREQTKNIHHGDAYATSDDEDSLDSEFSDESGLISDSEDHSS